MIRRTNRFDPDMIRTMALRMQHMDN